MSIGSFVETVHQARYDFELDRISHDLLANLYAGYNPDVDAELFVNEAMRIFPTGSCGLAAVYLQHFYGEGEVRYGKYAGKGHTVLNLGSLFVAKSEFVIADITCDQNGGPKVYVGKLKEPWSLE
jgi:hypothetical protein